MHIICLSRSFETTPTHEDDFDRVATLRTGISVCDPIAATEVRKSPFHLSCFRSHTNSHLTFKVELLAMHISTIFGISLVVTSLTSVVWAVPGAPSEHRSGSDSDATSTSSGSPAESSSSGDGSSSGSGQFANARLTYYSPSVGLGACGKQNDDQSFTVALNEACPGCPYGGLDLSPGLFQHFDSLDKGVLTASWSFKDGSGSSSGNSTSTSSESGSDNSNGNQDPSSTTSGSNGSGPSSASSAGSNTGENGPSQTTPPDSTPSDGGHACGA
ncbi:hypothetical protein A7U60_g752 [Sanghuangporus baumii]|uniref:Uncharacterized protein n=1 Tax=Sanghuangporus baumii TaxID=108892 RepID=A0A9Q5NBQ8_SANBA|nr:hypothetical protein A7U60_g752 [Sanghuangporus baumii]